MKITIIGYLIMVTCFLLGFVTSALFSSGKIRDLEDEIMKLRGILGRR